jgi:hypothetical protein
MEAVNLDRGKNTLVSAIVRVLDGLYCITNQDYRHAMLKLLEVQLPNFEDPEEVKTLSEVCTVNDLAYYVVICALISCSRKELKNTILKSNNFINLAGFVPEAQTIIEHYLNGNYHDFQRLLHQMQKQLKFDPFFGEYKGDMGFNVFKAIRH